MNDLMNRYFNVKKEIDNFYEDTFESESAELYVNKSIKKKLVTLIADAKKHSDIKIMRKSIKLLSDNTGCVEDVEILNSLLEEQNDIKKDILANSPIARWLE